MKICLNCAKPIKKDRTYCSGHCQYIGAKKAKAERAKLKNCSKCGGKTEAPDEKGWCLVCVWKSMIQLEKNTERRHTLCTPYGRI